MFRFAAQTPIMALKYQSCPSFFYAVPKECKCAASKERERKKNKNQVIRFRHLGPTFLGGGRNNMNGIARKNNNLFIVRPSILLIPERILRRNSFSVSFISICARYASCSSLQKRYQLLSRLIQVTAVPTFFCCGVVLRTGTRFAFFARRKYLKCFV